jgi:hypothetical protein
VIENRSVEHTAAQQVQNIIATGLVILHMMKLKFPRSIKENLEKHYIATNNAQIK